MSRNALLSVSNKEGIGEFAQKLTEHDFTIYSSGGTAKEIRKAGVPVVDVSTIVGGDAILGHKVVTLSRHLFAGILADTRKPAEMEEIERLGLPLMHLVCVDMYPLTQEIAKKDSTPESVTENTDIGGPTMLRAAAKGSRIVICDPADRTRVIDWLKLGEPENGFITELRAKAEYEVAKYAAASAQYVSQGKYFSIFGEMTLACKYGENAYQNPAALFSTGSNDSLALENFVLVEGTPPSYNNLCDLDRLLQILTHLAAAFSKNFASYPAMVVGVKHGNACGAAIGSQTDKAKLIEEMFAGDPVSIFGGLVMVNFTITTELAELFYEKMMEKKMLDGIIAPEISPEAIEMLKRKKGKCRFIVNKALSALPGTQSLDRNSRFRYVRGGILVQPNYTHVLDLRQMDENSTKFFCPKEMSVDALIDVALAWTIGSTSNSNTITIVKDGKLLGNAVGQQDRVGGAELAITRAKRSGHDLEGSVAYSDSFFPFPDAVEVLINAGVKTIYTSSGSINDKFTIELCESRGVNLIMVPDAEGRGFFGH